MADLSKSNMSAGNTINASDVTQIVDCLTGTKYDNFVPNGVYMIIGQFIFTGSAGNFVEYFNNTGQTVTGSRPDTSVIRLTWESDLSEGHRASFTTGVEGAGKYLEPQSSENAIYQNFNMYDVNGSGNEDAGAWYVMMLFIP